MFSVPVWYVYLIDLVLSKRRHQSSRIDVSTNLLANCVSDSRIKLGLKVYECTSLISWNVF